MNNYQFLVSEREQGKFVHYDPVRALEENARPARQQTLSYATNTKATDAAEIACLNNVNSSITNSYNCGNIVANNNVGGIYVSTTAAIVTNVYNTGRVHATRTNGSGYSCHGAIRPTANTTTETENVTNAYANEDFLFNELNTIIITDAKAWSGGEVAYKLGEAFGQKIGVDPLPVLGGMTVYENTLPDVAEWQLARTVRRRQQRV